MLVSWILIFSFLKKESGRSRKKSTVSVFIIWGVLIHKKDFKVCSDTFLVGVKLTSFKADNGIVFEPLQPDVDRKVLFWDEVFLLFIKSDIIESSREGNSLKWEKLKILKNSMNIFSFGYLPFTCTQWNRKYVKKHQTRPN